MGELEGKVVIITGSNSGIGKATAKLLIQEGAKVVINGRNDEKLNNAEKEINAPEGKLLKVRADITKPEQAKQLIDKTIEKFGKLDILINNAGVSMRGNFAELSPEVFETVFGINVFGVANTTVPAMEHIRKTKGSIIFISSAAGIRGLPGTSAYCSSKMALRALAESIRIEESKAGIHVGLIYVGITKNEKGKTTIAADGSLKELKDRSNFKVHTPERVAKAVVNNIKRRKFIKTLSGMAKINKVMQALFPGLVEFTLIKSLKKIEERNN